MELGIKQLAPDDRPREKLMEQGAEGLTNSELLAILIRTGTRDKSAITIAKELTLNDGFYTNIAKARKIEDLMHVKGLGPAKAATVLAALELGRRVAAASPRAKPKFSEPKDCADFLMPKLRYAREEKFLVLLLDTKSQLMRCEQIAQGSVDCAIVHPREVFAPAVLHQAASILVAHNHPSGNPQPSKMDIELTQVLRQTGKILHIPLVDHIVIGDGSYFSFSEKGYF